MIASLSNRGTRLLARLFIGLCPLILYAESLSIVVPFSAKPAGATVESTYRIAAIPQSKLNKFQLVDDAGITVLKVDSDNSAGGVTMPFKVDPAKMPILNWRWKVNRVLERGDINTKDGDDFAARVYVFFDVPLASLSFSERTKIRLARLVSGSDVPTAAICYVWDKNANVGFENFSPYTGRVRKIVVQSGGAHVNQWMMEMRDVAADFRRAFGTAPPHIIGVAIGSDTDQTHEKVTAWFGDVSFTKAIGQ